MKFGDDVNITIEWINFLTQIDLSEFIVLMKAIVVYGV